MCVIITLSVCYMCSCVAGDDATPENKAVQQSLSAMLTRYLYRQISKMTTREVKFYFFLMLPPLTKLVQILKMLNSNTENPYLIWDNRTRAELNHFLETQQQSMIRTVIFCYLELYFMLSIVRENVTNRLVVTFILTYSKMS